MEIAHRRADVEHRTTPQISRDPITSKKEKKKNFSYTMPIFITFLTKPVPQPLFPILIHGTWIPVDAQAGSLRLSSGPTPLHITDH